MITKLASNIDLKYKMRDNYYASTKKHLAGVFKYIDKIDALDPAKYADLPIRKLLYDASKNSEPEFTPYCFLLWEEKNPDFVLDSSMKLNIKSAILHHWKNNRHHPEFHDKNIKFNNVVSLSDDVPPNIIVDGTPMTDLDIAEMTADWCAIADDENMPATKWADEHIGKKYKFSKEQAEMIYNLIEKIAK